MFGPTAAAWAPLWVAERAITSWLAVLSRIVRGGVRYRTTVLSKAATPTRELRRRHAPSRFGSSDRAYASRMTQIDGIRR